MTESKLKTANEQKAKAKEKEAKALEEIVMLKRQLKLASLDNGDSSEAAAALRAEMDEQAKVMQELRAEIKAAKEQMQAELAKQIELTKQVYKGSQLQLFYDSNR